MKLDIGAEIDGEVYDSFRLVRKHIQDKFNSVFTSTDYGLPSFDFIAIIRSSAAVVKYPEIFKYNAKKKDCEYRIAINFDSFLAGTEEKKCSLICDALDKAFNHLMQQKPEAIDVGRMYADFSRVRNEQQW